MLITMLCSMSCGVAGGLLVTRILSRKLSKLEKELAQQVLSISLIEKDLAVLKYNEPAYKSRWLRPMENSILELNKRVDALEK